MAGVPRELTGRRGASGAGERQPGPGQRPADPARPVARKAASVGWAGRGEWSREEELARYYDLDVREERGDLDLYLALAARAGGPVLELACGSGRVAVPLAEAGHEVTGVDIDEAMLARARRRWSTVGSPALASGRTRRTRSAGGRGASAQEERGKLELIAGDLFRVDLGPRFALVFLALNTLLLLGDGERQRAALRAIARHLRPGGFAAVDVWLPDPDDLAAYDGRLTMEWVRDDPERGERVMKSAAATYDVATETVELHSLFDAWPPDGGPLRRVARTDRMRLLTPSELVRLAREAALEVETLAGDHHLTPFGPGAERVVFVGRLV